MYPRYIESKLKQSMEDAPAILLNGARQTGKSTLVKNLLEATHKYYTLDDINILNLVKSDPITFLDSQTTPIIIDAIQRCPELFLPLKKKIDDHKQPAQFVLTGSANILGLPALSESLAGRLEIHTLWPLSEVEIHSHPNNFIDAIFDTGTFNTFNVPSSPTDYMTAIFAGGYPDVRKRQTEERKDAWCDAYIQTLLYRDVRDLANIEKLTELPFLLSLLAARAATLLNASELSRSSGLPLATLKRYLYLLELLFLFVKIPAWSRNFSKRLVKSPKAYLNDTRLLIHLLGMHPASVSSTHMGRLLENFVATELIKQQTWAKRKTRLYHYRTQSGQEIDFILEAYDGALVAIEIKASKKIEPRFFDHIKNLHTEIPVKGIILYMGDEVLQYGQDMWALPVRTLWSA